MTQQVPLLFLPGSLCDKSLFQAQVSALGTSYDVITAPAYEHRTIAEIADAILETAPPVFALVGFSMGAHVAFEIVRKAPHRVDRLALLNSNPASETEAGASLRLKQMERIRMGGNAALVNVIRNELKPSYLSNESDEARFLRRRVMNMGVALGERVFMNQWMALLSRADSRELLGSIQCPTLVIGGEVDEVCPPHVQVKTAELLPNARLELIPGCGHLSPLEASAEVNAFLNDWLHESAA